MDTLLSFKEFIRIYIFWRSLSVITQSFSLALVNDELIYEIISCSKFLNRDAVVEKTHTSSVRLNIEKNMTVLVGG